jgi:hypothetical protein
MRDQPAALVERHIVFLNCPRDGGLRVGALSMFGRHAEFVFLDLQS